MYKLEMHLHVLGTSPCALTDEKTITEIYSKNGYNGIVYTSHYNSFLREYYKFKDFDEYNENFIKHYLILKTECAKKSIDVFFGMEFMPDETSYYIEDAFNAEFLIYGVTPDKIGDFQRLLKENTACMRNYCRENGYLVSQAHPFRSMINYRNPDVLDGVEVLNGNPRQNSRNDMAKKFAEENGLIMTAGSDFHETEDCVSGVILENAVKTEQELVAELKRRKHAIIQ